MLLFLCLFGLALGTVPPPDVPALRLQRGGCPMFWYSFNNRCYKYVATPATWADAELQCVSQGANLVSIHSLDEEKFVKFLIRNFDPTQGHSWMGLSDVHKEDAWMWSDGSPVDFVFWNAGEPSNYNGNEHCVHTNFETKFKWNDGQCFSTYASVCKMR